MPLFPEHLLYGLRHLKLASAEFVCGVGAVQLSAPGALSSATSPASLVTGFMAKVSGEAGSYAWLIPEGSSLMKRISFRRRFFVRRELRLGKRRQLSWLWMDGRNSQRLIWNWRGCCSKPASHCFWRLIRLIRKSSMRLPTNFTAWEFVSCFQSPQNLGVESMTCFTLRSKRCLRKTG